MRVMDLLISDSEYMCKEMLANRPPVRVTIDKVVGGKLVPVPGSSKKDKRNVMFFVGKEKGLVLNSGNRKFLVRVFGGRDTAEWKGREIFLYFDPTQKNKDGTKGGIKLAIGDEYSGEAPPNFPDKKSNPQPDPPHDPETGEVSDDADLSGADDYDRSA